MAIVWLEVPSDETATGLCRKHAERLSPPRGWTIDDRRDPTLRLFRPGPKDPGSRRSARKRISKNSVRHDQDALFMPDSPEEQTEGAVMTFENQSNSDRIESDCHEPQGLSPLLSRAFRGTPLSGD